MSISSKRLRADRLHTFRSYYKRPRFALIDLTFGFFALFSNPYRVCRKFLEKRGAENIHAYGETPLATYQRIAKKCGVEAGDTWVEMGAGRGKGCFWLAQFIGCRVIGIEWVPQFVHLANFIRALFCETKVRFVREDMEKADLTEATFVYLYGHWPKIEIPSGAKVIAISEPLEGFEIVKAFWVRYPWGRTRAFLQMKQNLSADDA